MKIALTPRFVNYVLDDCNAVFTPQVWMLLGDDEQFDIVTPEWELTDDGYDFADQYRDDASHGYDLCFGRQTGLADKYTEEQALYEIVTNPKYVTHPLDKDTSIYELIY